ncbi:MAG: PD-(D/E)XK nuclease family protein [Bacteroidales bacterium]|nr:PD-(D/E)XK nuclease family protein [Bacteroidales bacterium]
MSLVKQDYILKGKIDLVEGKDGTVELVDFKSGEKPDVNTRDEYKRQILNQYRRQLEIYAYLIEQRYGMKVSAMHLYYPKVEDGNPRITYRYQEKNIENTMEAFEEVVQKKDRKERLFYGERTPQRETLLRLRLALLLQLQLLII